MLHDPHPARTSGTSAQHGERTHARVRAHAHAHAHAPQPKGAAHRPSTVLQNCLLSFCLCLCLCLCFFFFFLVLAPVLVNSSSSSSCVLSVVMHALKKRVSCRRLACTPSCAPASPSLSFSLLLSPSLSFSRCVPQPSQKKKEEHKQTNKRACPFSLPCLALPHKNITLHLM